MKKKILSLIFAICLILPCAFIFSACTETVNISISNITKTSTNELVDTYTISYTDGTTTTFDITNGRDGKDGIGIKSAELVDNQLVITLDDTNSTKINLGNVKGQKGDKGADGKGISGITLTSQDGLIDTYTINYTDGTSKDFTVKNGKDGTGIDNITKTSTNGLVDTYTITYTDGKTTTFDITNGRDGKDGIGIKSAELVDNQLVITLDDTNSTKINLGNIKGQKGDTGATGNGISGIALTSQDGLVDTYTISYTNSTSTTFTVTNGADGNGINNITKTSTNGLVDTYTITYTNGTTTTFTVTNGKDGLSAYEIYKSLYDYTGTEQEWILDLINGKLSTINHTITFDSNGGTSVESQQVKHLENIVKPQDPTKLGYIFDGWYCEDEKWSFVGFVVTKDITLTAHWKLNTYSITYDLNGGINNEKNPATYYGNQGSITLFEPTKEHYDFVNWTLNGEIVDEIDTTKYENITLCANYVPTTYTITYVLNGGTNSQENPTTYTIETPDITLIPPTLDDEKVCRWYLEATFDNEITKISQGSFGNITLYAKYGYDYKDICEISNNKIVSIKKDIVENYNITELEIGEGITEIGADVFKNCTYFKKISIPSCVTSLEMGMFSGCSSLEEITLPFVGGSIKASSDTNQYPFGYIFGTSEYTDSYEAEQSYYGLDLSNPTTTTFYLPSSLIKVTIKGGNIVYGAFSHTNLKTIILENKVEEISEMAFDKSIWLKNISIPNEIKSIGKNVFHTFIKGLNLTTYDNAEYLGNSDNPYLILVKAKDTSITSCVINENTRFIYEDAFSDCVDLADVTISNSVEVIGEFAFKGCSGLTNIVVPNTVKQIKCNAFYSCTSLEEITLPFVGESIKTPSELYQYPFGYIFGTSSFADSYGVWQAHYYSSISEIYGATYYIPSSLRKVTITGGNILRGAFSSCSKLTDIILPNDITYISANAFFNCTNLLSIVIPNKVTIIEIGAFNGCTNLTNITIPNSVTSIAEDEFYYCDNLQYNEYDNAYYIGNDDNPYLVLMKAKNTSITSCEINENTRFIYEDAFSDCVNLESVIISHSVTTIGFSAFRNCKKLNNLIIPSSVVTLGFDVFDGCDGLRSIYCEATEKPETWETDWFKYAGNVYWYSETRPDEWWHIESWWHYVDGKPTLWE